MKTKPLYEFQSRVSEFARDKNRVGLFIFYGGGKTYLSLKWLEDIIQATCPLTSPLPVLVLTLKSIVPQWGQEIEKHTNFTYALCTGGHRQRVELIRRDVDICVINYDSVRSPPVLTALRHKDFRTIIADESTLLKESRTKRFKLIRSLTIKAPYKAILTGRPILERPEEIWSQMLFLDGGETFSTSFWRFRDKFFSPGPPWKPYDWTLRPGAGREIALKLRNRCTLVGKEEVLNELPPKVYNPVHFELPCRERYDRLRKEFAMELPSGELFSTQWAVVRSQKMHQLCQGFIYTEDHEYEMIHNLKLDWLGENIPLMLKEGPVLIWTHFIAAIELISVTLGMAKIPHRPYHGKLVAAARAEAIKDFQDAKVDVLILSEQAGGAGLNLQRANQAVFFSTGYRAGARENAEDRCHRIGSEVHKSVTYYDLVMKNTLDTVVLQAIAEKQDMADAILKHIKET